MDFVVYNFISIIDFLVARIQQNWIKKDKKQLLYQT